MNTTDELPRVTVAADVAAPDRIAFGLTFRQLAIIGGAGFCGFGVYRLAGRALPAVVWLILAIPVAAAVFAVALGRRDGLALDVWLRHALTHLRAGRRPQVPGRPEATALAAVAGDPVSLAPLRLPVTAISPLGVLTADGTRRRVIACGGVNIHLRTGDEQASLLDGFGRILNSLTGPAQLLVSAHRHDLIPLAQAILDAAPRLPGQALQAAAADHARFLADLDAERDPLRRQVLIVVPGEQPADATVRALHGLGVGATVLDGPSVTAALAAAVDPYTPPVCGPRAVPGTPITLRSPT